MVSPLDILVHAMVVAVWLLQVAVTLEPERGPLPLLPATQLLSRFGVCSGPCALQIGMVEKDTPLALAPVRGHGELHPQRLA